MNDTFFKLVGFSKYECNEKLIVRSEDKKRIVSKDNGGKSIRMYNDAGDRKSLSMDKLKELYLSSVTKKAVKPVKTKSTGEKSERKVRKISAQQAKEIRERVTAGAKQKALAEEFKVHASTISDIVNFVTKKN